ncbi:Copper amine oxidase, N2-terminal [Dillenia turbinata]|uniref:Copper amine oxidase, N2-terminal n=1 Tax=Dillenia turbinata TaxID=194707 RepID=A0AAN8W9I3_9MAGN
MGTEIAESLLRFMVLIVCGLLLILILGQYPCAPSEKAPWWCTFKDLFESSTPKVFINPICHQTHNHATDVPHHPLDALTLTELNQVRTIILSHRLFNTASSYSLQSVVLEEPPKPLVLRWTENEPMLPRKASAIAIVDGKSHVLTVDLSINQGSGYGENEERDVQRDDVGAVRAVYGSDRGVAILDGGTLRVPSLAYQ